MKRVEGNPDQLLMCINPIRNRWLLLWDVVKNEDGSSSYMEEVFDHKPSLSEIKSLIRGWYNSEINAKILGGFLWNGIPVWLSTENQINFKAIHDLAGQTSGANLPVKLKLGEDKEENPVYFTFHDFEILSNFYTRCVKYIGETLDEGREAKDAIDWSVYDI